MCIPLAIVTDAAEVPFELAEFCGGEEDSALLQGSFDRLAHIHNDIDGVSSAITSSISTAESAIINNDNANTTTLTTAISNTQSAIINNDNSNKTAIINNDNANTTTLTPAISDAVSSINNSGNANKNELKDLLLRTQIEADLAENDAATPVAMDFTPTANGGYLDLVQTIVTQTLANIQAAGGSIGQAQVFLDQANAQEAAGQFKAAYKSYRKAYKMAANASRGTPSSSAPRRLGRRPGGAGLLERTGGQSTYPHSRCSPARSLELGKERGSPPGASTPDGTRPPQQPVRHRLPRVADMIACQVWRRDGGSTRDIPRQNRNLIPLFPWSSDEQHTVFRRDLETGLVL